MKAIIGILLALMCLTSLQAAPDREMTVKATVHGMVCFFCAWGLIAHFKTETAVMDVHVDLGRKMVMLREKKGESISYKRIEKAVVASGFKLVKVERSDEAFKDAQK